MVIVPLTGDKTGPQLVNGFIFVVIVRTLMLLVLAFGMPLIVKRPDADCPKTGGPEKAAGQCMPTNKIKDQIPERPVKCP